MMLVGAISAPMLACVIAGGVYLSESRALQRELENRMDSNTAYYGEGSSIDDPKIQELREEISRKNERGTILGFAGVEWFLGFSVFRAAVRFRKYRPLSKLQKKEDRLGRIVLDLERAIAAAESVTRAFFVSVVSRKKTKEGWGKSFF
jgi:hypothetical protein